VVSTGVCGCPQTHFLGHARARLILGAFREQERGDADGRQRQDVGTAVRLQPLLVGQPVSADVLYLPFERDFRAVVIARPFAVVFWLDQGEGLALAEAEHDDKDPQRVQRVTLAARRFEELPCLVDSPGVPAPELLPRLGQLR
jgi:hypothetical protein